MRRDGARAVQVQVAAPAVAADPAASAGLAASGHCGACRGAHWAAAARLGGRAMLRRHAGLNRRWLRLPVAPNAHLPKHLLHGQQHCALPFHIPAVQSPQDHSCTADEMRWM